MSCLIYEHIYGYLCIFYPRNNDPTFVQTSDPFCGSTVAFRVAKKNFQYHDIFLNADILIPFLFAKIYSLFFQLLSNFDKHPNQLETAKLRL